MASQMRVKLRGCGSRARISLDSTQAVCCSHGFGVFGGMPPPVCSIPHIYISVGWLHSNGMYVKWLCLALVEYTHLRLFFAHPPRMATSTSDPLLHKLTCALIN